VLLPVNWKPGRHGLASTLFEILSFRPVRMRTQVLVWSLARKASYTFPMPRKLSEDLEGQCASLDTKSAGLHRPAQRS
jgi:hypothetical protein